MVENIGNAIVDIFGIHLPRLPGAQLAISNTNIQLVYLMQEAVIYIRHTSIGMKV